MALAGTDIRPATSGKRAFFKAATGEVKRKRPLLVMAAG
jgi:hypothetical protein